MPEIVSILIGIILLGLIILIHEFGHFIFCKISKVKVLRFSIGFGPPLLRKKIGGTEFMISAIPFGGYVSPLDEEKVNEIKKVREEIIQELQAKGVYDIYTAEKMIDQVIEKKFGGKIQDTQVFEKKPYISKFLIVFGGPLFNILTAIFAMYLILVLGIEKIGNRIGDVMKDSPAEKAGLQKGDIIIEVNGHPTKTWNSIKTNIMMAGDKIKIKVLRNNEEIEIEITPMKTETGNIIGIYPDTDYKIFEKYGILSAIPHAFSETYKFLKLFVRALKLVFSKEGLKSLGGPIALTKITSEAAQSGIRTVLMVIFFISINLGILNLLPIPLLDGGNLAIITAETIFRRRFSPQFKQAISIVGIIILSTLLVIAMLNDVKNIFIKGRK